MSDRAAAEPHSQQLPMRRVIITGDDFGLSIAVNQAIEQAHRHGILAAASLMVAEPAADDAIARALSMPSLSVGLHLVVVRGRPLLPPEHIPDLVDDTGRLRTNLAGAGINIFLRPSARRQLEAEIRAQFERFRESGLTLDHVNGHCHLHLHPTILGMILKIGPEYGMRAIRLPYEPFAASWRAMRFGFRTRFGHGVLLLPWIALMRARFKRAGIAHNDYLFGINDTGHLTADRVLALLSNLPDGVSELHFHPAASNAAQATADKNPDRIGFEAEQELAALTDRRVAMALDAAGIKRIAFADLVPA